MSKKTRRVFRPQNMAAILGMGVLSVATVGLVVSSLGGSLPFVAELASAAVGVIGGTKAVLAA